MAEILLITVIAEFVGFIRSNSGISSWASLAAICNVNKSCFLSLLFDNDGFR
jgi:hypothetical protein